MEYYNITIISSQTTLDEIIPHRRLFALLDSRPVLQQLAVSHGRQHQPVHHHRTGQRKTSIEIMIIIILFTTLLSGRDTSPIYILVRKNK